MEKRTRPDELPSGTFFLDDSNISMIKYSGAFSQISNSTCQGGTCTRLTSSSSSLEFTFNGTDVWLFGMPGGITRVFLDNQLVDVLDTQSLAYNGSALWASTNLRQGPHAVKLGGVDGEGLNLIIDFFSINGGVTSTGGTDANYLPPEKLTPIIVGTILGFLALLAIIGLAFFLRIRRKKQKQIRKSGIKLVKVVEPPADTEDAAGTAEPKEVSSPAPAATRGGFFSGIFPRRQGTLLGFGGRRGAGAQSPDGLSPFLQGQSHASTGSSYPSTSANVYSPPTSADPLVPFFPRSNSPPRRQKTQPGEGTNSARPSIEQALGQAGPSGSTPPVRGQVKPVVALANNAAAGGSRPMHTRNNDSFASRNSEDAPLMETRPKHPPAYDQSQQIQQQRQQQQQLPAGGVTAQGFPDEKSRATGSTPATTTATPTPVSTPPITAPTSGVLWSATTASNTPMTSSTSQHQQTSSTSSASQYPPEKATYKRAVIPSSPPPSFLDIDAQSPPPGGAAPAVYRNPTAAVGGSSSTTAAMVAAAQRNNAIQQAKNMKGPRPRDGSSPPPTAQGRQLPTAPVDNGRGAGTRVEDWNRLGGVAMGSSTSLSNRRNPDDFPESPIDPAVQWS